MNFITPVFMSVMQISRQRSRFTFQQTERVLEPTGFLHTDGWSSEFCTDIMLFEDYINIILMYPGYIQTSF